MKCPYCNKEMELGYIQSRDGLNWSPKKLLIPVFAPLKKGSVSLANDAAEYADAQFTVESLKIDGKDIALSSNECDVYEYDGIIDAYIYDSWDESGMIDAESIGAWSTIEVTFTVSGF